MRWARTVLHARNIEITGAAVETKRRAWSLLARIPTDAGTMWVKANARAFAHEGPLLRLLARLRPGSVLEPFAVHADNGWLLSPDGGATAGDSGDRWAALVRHYADLQHALITHVADLRATGTPYLPPSELIGVYRHFESRAPGLGARIEAAAAALAESGRLSIEHNDLHPGNVFARDPGPGLLFDWGDAVITHPFLSHRLLHSPYRAEYFARWRQLERISEAEIATAERLAPLVALHPWRTVENAEPAFDRVRRDLLDELRAHFG
ncbi:phosphotransferase [Nocardia beijingensis]|uniref:phosphotransferase n=1 Tax=Nocardia beijingensis TaxID=95162 RepID=UPI0033CA8696